MWLLPQYYSTDFILVHAVQCLCHAWKLSFQYLPWRYGCLHYCKNLKSHFLSIPSSHCSEYFQMIQNETISRKCLLSGIWKSNKGTDQVSAVDVLILLVVIRPKTALQECCWEVQCHDVKSTCLAKGMVAFETLQNMKVFGWQFWRNRFVMNNSFNMKCI